MRQARSTVGYIGEERVGRQFGDTIKFIHKRVIVNPARRFIWEEAILQPEERSQLQMQWGRGMRGRPGMPQRMNLRWNQDFQRNIASEEHFADILLRPDLLQRNYSITIAQGEQVAGRQTILMSISPKYEFRPGNRLWIDSEIGIILKREIYTSKNPDIPLYREEMVSLEFKRPKELDSLRIALSPPPMPPPFPPMRPPGPVRPNEYMSLNDIPPQDKIMMYLPDSLPPGFVLDKISITREPRNTVYHQIYTDGLIMFSLFQLSGRNAEQLVENDPRAALFLPGNKNPYGSIMLTRRVDNNYFVIIGAAQEELLQKVLNNIPEKR